MVIYNVDKHIKATQSGHHFYFVSLIMLICLVICDRVHRVELQKSFILLVAMAT